MKSILVVGLVAMGLYLVMRSETPTRPNKEIAESPTGADTSDPPASNPTLGRMAVVTHVVDGDTVDVEFRHRELRIRLIGVDTPEVYFGVECGGPEASAFTEAKLDGADVWLEFDVERLDPYDRTLAYVWLGDRLFNQALVARGYATVDTHPPNDRYEDRFLAAQRRARDASRGLWATCAL